MGAVRAILDSRTPADVGNSSTDNMSAPTRVAVGAVVEALSALKKTVLVLHGDRLSIPPVSILISCHAHNSDASDFALGVEAEQKAGRIAAREDEFHDGECLILLHQ